MDGAGDAVALNDSFEGPGDRVAGDFHIAVEFDLVGVNYSLEIRVVDLTILHAGEFVATLLDRELLLAGAPGVLDCDGPCALHRGWSSGWNYGILVVAGFGEGLVDGVRYDSILAGIHHVRHDSD